MKQTQLKDGTTIVKTRDVAIAAADVMRVIAKNVRTDDQRAEVLHVLFETRPGQAMLKALESGLGLALVPVNQIV
jgi:hypothetical protein